MNRSIATRARMNIVVKKTGLDRKTLRILPHHLFTPSFDGDF